MDPDEQPVPSIRTDDDDGFHSSLLPLPTSATQPDASFSAASMLSPSSANHSLINPQDMFHSPTTPQMSNAEAHAAIRQPFNFTTQQYEAGRRASMHRASNEALGKRRGHKYRHSSIHASHMDTILHPPAPHRTALAVPASLPVPTRKEAWFSMTADQTIRFVWCLCHFAVSAMVQFAASGSLAMTALSRLLLFDAAGAIVCVAVDVMGNFDVWKRSSIKHPFGLERADVLAGFGMAVFIAFMGLDVISHGVQHSLENVGSHVPHSAHAHERVAARSVQLASLLAIVSTLISTLLLKNHARIGRAMRFEAPAGWGKIFGNPAHFLTLSCSILLLVLPYLGVRTYSTFDVIISFLIASLMIAFGVRLGTALASMLLMSYRPSHRNTSVQDVISDIETEPGVSGVEEARFWQVHYGLCMANLKLRYHDAGVGGYAADEVARIRQRVMSVVRQRLGGGPSVRWEVSLQMTAEKD